VVEIDSDKGEVLLVASLGERLSICMSDLFLIVWATFYFV
jgi:hypothetical protein